MSDIQKRLEQIQQEQSTIGEVTKDKIKEMVANATNRHYPSQQSSQQQSLLSKMLPSCYPKASVEGTFKVNIQDMNMDNLHEETVFYIFYSFPGDELQLKAYNNIIKRKYMFCKIYKCFVFLTTSAVVDHIKRSIVMFDPYTWSKVSVEVSFDEKFIRSLEK